MTATTTAAERAQAATAALAEARAGVRPAEAKLRDAEAAAASANADLAAERTARLRAWAERQEADAWSRESRAEAAVTEALIRFHEAVLVDHAAAMAAYIEWREARSGVNVERERRLRMFGILDHTEEAERLLRTPKPYGDGDLVPTFDRMVHEAVTERVVLTLARQRAAIEAEIAAARDGAH